MGFTEEELEELLTINVQAKIFTSGLSYIKELENAIFECMKNKTELSKENIQKAHNNYLVLNIIGLNQCDSETFKKLDKYMDTKYRE